MRDGFRGLGLRQPVIHSQVEMGGKLSDLAGSHEGADRHKAAVAWGEIGTQPEVAEQDVGRVLHDAREGRAELLADAVGSVCLLGLVERKQRRRRGGELIEPDRCGGRRHPSPRQLPPRRSTSRRRTPDA